MDVIVFDIWGITGILLAGLCWYMASKHRVDGKRWEVSLVPIWNLRDRYDRKGYRYLWVGYLLIVAAVLPDLLYRTLAR